MANNFRLSPIVIAVVLVFGFLVYLNLPEPESEQQSRRSVTPVVIHQVSVTEFPVVVEALGTARANEAVIITAQKNAVIRSVHFEDGDLVEAGQLLITQDNREELARVNELDVNIQEAKRQLARVKNLARESVASEQLLDEQQARVKALTAQREVAKAQLAELEVKSPFAGKLGIRQVSLGALIGPGDMITTLDDLAKVKVDFSIAENHLPTVALGQTINALSIAYPGESFSGQISSIDSRLDATTRSIQVRAVIDNPELKLRPGMLLQINLQKQLLNTLTVPEKALVPIEDKQFVYVIKDQKAEMREVEVGRRKPGIVQITNGLSSGEQVVMEGTLRLRNGSAVRVLERDQS